jgi:hypothetical protein
MQTDFLSANPNISPNLVVAVFVYVLWVSTELLYVILAEGIQIYIHLGGELDVVCCLYRDIC